MTETEAEDTRESLNFKIPGKTKQRLIAQAGRLDLTQTATARVCLILGLEAFERLHADAEK